MLSLVSTDGYLWGVTEPSDTIGLIAGNRSLPLLFAQQARAQGVKRLVAAAFEGETDPRLADLVDDIVWLKVGQLSKMISGLKQRGVRQCVMLGQISPRNLFELRPDLRAISLLLKLKEKNAHSIFSAIAEELNKEGIELIAPVRWLQSLMPTAGFSLGPKLSDGQKQNVAFGFAIAKKISALEIGQTVVVKDGAVLAVEAFEGTDNCLRRGGALVGASGGGVAVKVAKEKHDLRFDVPCFGKQTIEVCHEAKISVFGFESAMTLLLDMETVASLAKKYRITVAAVSCVV
jgi:DUF1009 family protein